MTDRTKHDVEVRDKLRCVLVADRVRRHVCVACGSSDVVYALCESCKKLDKYKHLVDTNRSGLEM
jgi:hypothetical protein